MELTIIDLLLIFICIASTTFVKYEEYKKGKIKKEKMIKDSLASCVIFPIFFIMIEFIF